MPAAYSMDLRERVMRDIDAGMRRCDVAAKYCVSKDWITKLKRLRRERGTFAPIQQKYHTASKLDGQLDELQQTVHRRPDATLKDRMDSRVERVGFAWERGKITMPQPWDRC